MGEDRIIRGDMAICKPEWREARKERNWAVQVVQIVGAEDSLLVVERDMTLKVRQGVKGNAKIWVLEFVQ